VSESTKAVFLSYASQDAEAAKRIAEALRAAGVEVWFDQSELRGGDAWDAKIRRQIKECALFVPIISANTNARAEGYFRLEWKLAVDRSHLLADDHPFLFPIVVGDLNDATARVPDKFREVQWTRVRLDESPAELAARVARLLAGESATAGAAFRRDDKSSAAKKSGLEKWWWLIFPVMGMSVPIIAVFKRPARPRPEPPAATAPVSESQRLVEQGRELISMSRRGSSKWEAVALLCERALALDPVNAEALALASQVDSRLWFHARDRTPQRSESARSRAARALDLAPKSLESRLAQATYLVLVAGLPQATQAEPALQQLRREFPPDARVLSVLANILMSLGRYDEALACHDEAARLPGNEAVAFREKGWDLHRLRRVPEMEAALERSIQYQPTGGNVSLRVRYDLAWHGDPDRALASLSRLPPEELAEDNGLSAAILVYRWRRDAEAMLRLLGAVPRDWIWWGVYGPKAAFTGDAHAAAGRLTAARTDWQTALALTEQKLASAPNDSNYLEWKAYLHMRLGEVAAAQEAFQRSLEAPKSERWTVGIEKLAFIAPADQVVAELERRVAETVAALEQKRHITGQLIAAADLRLNPGWDPVRANPRFQALQTKLDADPRFNPKAKPAESIATKADDKSVAVLAFANLSSDKEQEFFSDGISEEVLNVLAKVPGLKVSARTSAFFFKGKEVPIPEIAKQLGVAYVVEGSVQRAGDRVKITAQLIKAADGFHVWSDSFTRDMRDIFAVQDEIAAKITTSLTDKLGMTLPVSAKTTPEAYTLYLQARATLAKRGVPNLREAVRMFDRVIAMDPDYLPARSGLAISLALIPAWSRSLALGENLDMINRARREARLVIERQPGNAEAWSALGYILSIFDWRWQEAAEAVARSLALAPNDAEIVNFAGDYYRMVVANPQVVETEKRAVELNPLQSVNHTDLSVCYISVGQYELAIEPGRRGISIAPELVENYEYLLRPYGLLRRFDEMRAILAEARRVAPENSALLANMEILAAIYEGRNTEALELLEEFQPHVEHGGYSPAEYGSHYLRLGQREKAVHWLLRGAKGHDLSLIDPTIVDLDRIAADPVTRVVLEEPGLKELMEVRARNARATKTQK